MVVQGQLSSPLIALVTYRHVKNWFTQFNRQKPNNIMLRQQTFFLTFMNRNFQFMIFTLVNDHFLVWPSWVILTFNWPEQMFQMNNCAKLFLNPFINIGVMAQTSSIYDHFIIWPSGVTLTFNLPEDQMCQIILKSMHKWP